MGISPRVPLAAAGSHGKKDVLIDHGVIGDVSAIVLGETSRDEKDKVWLGWVGGYPQKSPRTPGRELVKLDGMAGRRSSTESPAIKQSGRPWKEPGWSLGRHSNDAQALFVSDLASAQRPDPAQHGGRSRGSTSPVHGSDRDVQSDQNGNARMNMHTMYSLDSIHSATEQVEARKFHVITPHTPSISSTSGANARETQGLAIQQEARKVASAHSTSIPDFLPTSCFQCITPPPLQSMALASNRTADYKVMSVDVGENVGDRDGKRSREDGGEAKGVQLKENGRLCGGGGLKKALGHSKRCFDAWRTGASSLCVACFVLHSILSSIFCTFALEKRLLTFCEKHTSGDSLSFSLSLSLSFSVSPSLHPTPSLPSLSGVNNSAYERMCRALALTQCRHRDLVCMNT
jgi:hypothetical protein